MLKVRLARACRRGPAPAWPAAGRVLGKIEEYFAETMTPGDTFLFAGEVLRFEGIRENEAYVPHRGRRRSEDPVLCGRQVPALDLSSPSACARCWPTRRVGRLPRAGADWLRCSRRARCCPGRATCWSRRFRAASRYYMVCYPVRGPAGAPDARHAADAPARARAARGRSASSPPITRSRSGGCAISARMSAGKPGFLDDLFDEDMLGDDLEAWLAESALMKRTFRNCAIIAGLIERRYPGPGEDRPAGDGLDRPRLRRAAQARARPHPAAGRAGAMRRPACSMSSGWAKCWRASGGKSCISRSTGFRRSACRSCWRSAGNGCSARRGRNSGGGGSDADRRGDGVTALARH